MGIPLFEGRGGGSPQVLSAYAANNSNPILEGLRAGQQLALGQREIAAADQQMFENQLTQPARMRNANAIADLNEAQATRTKSRLPFEMQLDQLELQKAQAENQLMPLKQEIERLQTESTLAITEDSLTRRKNVLEIFRDARAGNGAGALDALEQGGLADLAGMAITRNAKGDVEVDPLLSAQISALPSIVGPELRPRAQNMLASFSDLIEEQKLQAKGEPSGDIYDQTDPTRYVDSGDPFAPVPQGAPRTQPTYGPLPNQQQPQTTPVENQVAPPQRQGGADIIERPVTQEVAGQAPAAKEFPFGSPAPAVQTPADQEAVREAARQESIQVDQGKPVTKQLDGPGLRFTNVFERRQRLADTIRAQNPRMSRKDAFDEADRQLPKPEWTDTQEKYTQTMRAGLGLFQEQAQRGVALQDRLKALYQMHPEIAPLGAGMTAEKWVEVAKSKYKDPTSQALLGNILPELKAIAGYGVQTMKLETGAGTLMFNSDKDTDLYTSMSTGEEVDYGLIEQAISIAGAKTYWLKQRLENANTLREKFGGFDTVKTTDEDFTLRYPPTVLGERRGKSYLVPNQDIPPSDSYLKGRFFDLFDERGPDGRVQTPSASPDELGTLARDIVSNPYVPDKSTVPEHQTTASEGTLRRQIAAESNFDSEAVGPKRAKVPTGAKGLMQLADPTGKQLWKDLHKQFGFEGEYDPFDDEKNVIMGATHMNRMLAVFQGNTRLALAGYVMGQNHEGIKAIQYAQRMAKDVLGDDSWHNAKHYFDRKKIPKETIDYVEKIMGDNNNLPGVKHVTPREKKSAVESLPTQEAQNNARSWLSRLGFSDLDNAAMASTVDDLKDTLAGKALAAMLSPGPVGKAIGAVEGAAGPAPVETDNVMALAGAPNWNEVYVNGTQGIKDAPAEFQGFIMGAARGLAYGGDRKLGAVARMLTLGEDWPTAHQNAIAISENIRTDSPKMFIAGEFFGGAISPINKILGVGKAAKTAVSEAAATLKPLAERSATGVMEFLGSAARGAGRAAKAGVVPGAKAGATAGALSTESNSDTVLGVAGDTAVNTLIGGTVGAAGGAVLSMLPGAVEGALTSNTVVQAGAFAGKNLEKALLSEGGQIIFNALKDQPKAVWRKYLQDTRKSNSAVDNFLNTFGGEDNAIRMAEMIGREPGLAGPIRNLQGEILGGRKERFESKFYGNAKAPESEAEFRSLSEGIAADTEALYAKRRADAKVLYEKAESQLPQERTRAQPTTSVTGQSNTKPGQFPKMTGTAQVGVFKSPELDNLANDPVLGQVYREAVTKANESFANQPPNSFKVQQLAFQTLRETGEKGKDNVAKAQRDAAERLQTILGDESKTFKKANLRYKETSEKIEDFEDKAGQKLADISDKLKGVDANKMGDQLFSYDSDTLRTLVNRASSETKAKYAHAAEAHIMKQLRNQGERAAGEKQTLPDFSKNNFVERMKILVQDKKKGQDYEKFLKREKKIAQTANSTFKGESPTPHDRKQTGAFKQMVGRAFDAFASLKIFGLSGIPRAGRDVEVMAEVLDKNPLTRKAAREVTAILLTDPAAGRAFAINVLKQLERDKVELAYRVKWRKTFDILEEHAETIFNKTAGFKKGDFASLPGRLGGAVAGENFEVDREKTARARLDRERAESGEEEDY